MEKEGKKGERTQASGGEVEVAHVVIMARVVIAHTNTAITSAVPIETQEGDEEGEEYQEDVEKEEDKKEGSIVHNMQQRGNGKGYEMLLEQMVTSMPAVALVMLRLNRRKNMK